MKILAVNKFYYMRGGAEVYYFGVNDILKQNGHEVIPFSMKDNRNIGCTFDTYFVNNVEEKRNIICDNDEYFINNIEYSNMSLIKKIENGAKMIYSLEASKKIEKLIKETNPDIAHINNYNHQLTTSILQPLKKAKVPIINTTHDLKAICPNYQMLNRNGICEECKGGKYYNCFKNSCGKDSKADSLMLAIEAYVNKWLKSYDKIDKFICPSEFYKKKFIEFGIAEDRIVHLPNFVDIELFEPKYEGDNYFLYIGRLSKEKGLMTLVKAMKGIKGSKLLIVGTGPMEEELKAEAEKQNLGNIEFLGYKTGDVLKELIRNCKFIVLPSEWYENCPMSVIEAMAYGKAVIGSDMGGIPELVEDGITGGVFKAGSIEDLTFNINNMLENASNTIEQGKAGREKAEKLYDKNIHYEKLMGIYQEVIRDYNTKI